MHIVLIYAENEIKYPVSFNGKTRFTIILPAEMKQKEVEQEHMFYATYKRLHAQCVWSARSNTPRTTHPNYIERNN